MKRAWRAWGVAVVVGLLAACSSGAQSDAPSRVEPDPDGSDQFPCSPGSACYCPVGGFRGTTICSGSQSSCECPVCPALELHEAPHVESCGGEPFGTWRLTKIDLGTSKLTLSSFDKPIGECDLSTRLTGALPNLLMTLSEGGAAKYFAPNAVAKVSWNDSCVTSKVSTFGCQSQVWTNGYNCALSCDICSCDSNLAAVSNEDSSWQRTASTLTLAPWGEDISFDYCLKDNVLELSSEAMFLAYERVNTLSTPKPCAGRSAAECITGEGCNLGACVGGAACEQVGSEGSCLTLKGCSWNAQQCQGRGQVGCSLADFGKVPGCEFVDKPLICTGNQPACSTRSLATCAGAGCKLNETGRCSGPTLPCEDFFACPDGYCQFNNSVCSGVTSCSAYKSKEQCGYPNSNLPDPRCQWEASWCEGEPLPCEHFSQEECGGIEGCQLTPAP